jgi:plasmid stabilization system protein ParE
LIEYHKAADKEVFRIYRRYYKQSPNVARKFLAELQVAVNEVEQSPELWPEHLHGTRFRRLNRYPHYVVYLILADRIKIVAVQHSARRPGYWVRRLRR